MRRNIPTNWLAVRFCEENLSVHPAGHDFGWSSSIIPMIARFSRHEGQAKRHALMPA